MNDMCSMLGPEVALSVGIRPPKSINQKQLYSKTTEYKNF